MFTCCQLGPYEQTPVKFKSKYKFFIQENASENGVGYMVGILARRDELTSPHPIQRLTIICNNIQGPISQTVSSFCVAFHAYTAR